MIKSSNYDKTKETTHEYKIVGPLRLPEMSDIFFIISLNAVFPFPSIAQIIECNFHQFHNITFSYALSFL